MDGLAAAALPADSVGLLEGVVTTRAVRRYRDEPVPPDVLRTVLFAATRAPSGSNRQPFARSAREFWAAKHGADGYGQGSGLEEDSPKARMARTMQQFVDNFEAVPVLILPCLLRYREPNPMEGGSIYPACQNILLAARALGYGGVFEGFERGGFARTGEAGDHDELIARIEATTCTRPAEAWIAATITLGRPEGSHGPVRRRPMGELVFEDRWGNAAPWAVDPPGTRHTSAGPPTAAGPSGGDL